MAYHYSANQYEAAYRPRALRNWEVAKHYGHIQPEQRWGRSKIISNDRGHLLPGVPKKQANPWGTFVGTWSLPNKIDRKTADELNGTLDKRGGCFTCECKIGADNSDKTTPKVVKETEEVKESVPAGEKNEGPKDVMEPTTIQAPEDTYHDFVKNNRDINNNNFHPVPYVPGDFTEEKHRHDSYDQLSLNRFEDNNLGTAPKTRLSADGYPKYKDDFSKLPEIEEKPITRQDVEDLYREMVVEKNRFKHSSPASSAGKEERKKSPIVSAIKNFQLAKQLHRENLEHDPLPDTITNSMYRKLQMQGAREPGLALPLEEGHNIATGVGYKGHPGYGPTRCTKLKVFRPKTCDNHPKKGKDDDSRPSSSNSFDLKWRFIRQRKVTPIELAICWDLTPEDPQDEPKRTTHIDGSNGSQAPAVFAMVTTPKEESRRSSVASGDNNKALFEKRPNRGPDEKDFVLDRPKSFDNFVKTRAKSAYHLNTVGVKQQDDNVQHDNCRRCDKKNQSTPNLSGGVVKESNNSNRFSNKMAFKAGVPHKSKDKRQEYPEHWRLATVYQHSYKPIHARKRSLLATVFK